MTTLGRDLLVAVRRRVGPLLVTLKIKAFLEMERRWQGNAYV